MKIMTAAGEIVEGQPITEAESSIMEDLLSTEGVLYAGVYLASHQRKAITGALFAKYHITLREQPDTDTEEFVDLVDEFGNHIDEVA